MRICFVYDMIYPYSKGGGEKRFHELARRLAPRHEVHWLGLKLWDGPSTLTTEDGITLHGVAPPPGAVYVANGRRALLEPVWFGALLLQHPGLRQVDIIDCSSFPFFSIFSVSLLAALARVPLVVTWHEFWGDYWRDYAPRLAPLGKLVERLALRCSGSAIAVSEYTRERLVRAGMAGSSISVVPNGISRQEIEAARPLPAGPDILFVGRLIREKRVDLLLQALAVEPLARLQATCWVIGDGADGPRLKRLAHHLGLDRRVRFVSWMSEEEVYGAMKSAKVLALLSEREGFGMVALEAMACGTPVVVSPGKNSAAPMLVRGGRCGYVIPPIPGQLSAGLARLITEPELRTALAARGVRRAHQYDWSRITDRAEAVYREAAGVGH